MAIIGERTVSAIEYRNKGLIEDTERLFKDTDNYLRDYFFESSYYYAEIEWDGNDVEIYAENDGYVKLRLYGREENGRIKFYGGRIFISFYYDVPYTAYIDFSGDLAEHIYGWMVENGIEIREEDEDE